MDTMAAALQTQAAPMVATEAATAAPSAPAATPIGVIEQRYGLLASQETVSLDEAICRSGDLAVADRLAFVHAAQTGTQVVVVELDGWFVVGRANRHLTAAQAAAVVALPGGARLLSVVCERGITPVVAPLVTPAGF
jgi:hypothetical protein